MGRRAKAELVCSCVLDLREVVERLVARASRLKVGIASSGRNRYWTDQCFAASTGRRVHSDLAFQEGAKTSAGFTPH